MKLKMTAIIHQLTHWSNILFARLPMAVLFVSLGCSDDQNNQPQQRRLSNQSDTNDDELQQPTKNAAASTRIDETRAIEIAEHEFVKRAGANRVKSRVVEVAPNGYWIEVESLPRTPGAHCSIFVLFDGTVSEFHPGR
jgi:hypothetical protein